MKTKKKRGVEPVRLLFTRSPTIFASRVYAVFMPKFGSVISVPSLEMLFFFSVCSHCISLHMVNVLRKTRDICL